MRYIGQSVDIMFVKIADDGSSGAHGYVPTIMLRPIFIISYNNSSATFTACRRLFACLLHRGVEGRFH
jgi:hypothetical protein